MSDSGQEMMVALRRTDVDSRPDLAGVEPGHPATIMLAHGPMLEAYGTYLKSRAWREGELLLAWPVDQDTELVPVTVGQTALVEVWPEHDALYTVETVVRS